MVTRQALATTARDFLKAVAETAKAELGSHPERLQRSTWMVRTGPSGMSSREFERKVFPRAAVSRMYQIEIRDDFPQAQALGAALAAAGIPAEEMRYGFFLPLVHHWLELPDPFAFEETATSKVLDEFVDAVIDGRVVTRSRHAIDWLDLTSEAVALEKGISIRRVTEDELWEFGDIDRLEWQFPHFLSMPSEEWKILDIEVQYVRQEVYPPRIGEAVREAALAALRLTSSGSLQIVDLGQQANYGMGALGRVRSVGLIPRQLGRWEGAYVLNAEVTERLRESWPRLREIMESAEHYLRLPAQRLVDGGGRDRLEDAILDYAIGLEALLTAGITDELRYRFALRGATILSWDGGKKREFFEELRNFYDVRSFIVHGSHVDPTRLNNARSVGENALRKVWWWYFMKGTLGLMEATSRIDHRILE